MILLRYVVDSQETIVLETGSFIECLNHMHDYTVKYENGDKLYIQEERPSDYIVIRDFASEEFGLECLIICDGIAKNIDIKE